MTQGTIGLLKAGNWCLNFIFNKGTMKVYRQDPTLFRDHFHRQVGGALPGFKGACDRYGDGIG